MVPSVFSSPEMVLLFAGLSHGLTIQRQSVCISQAPPFLYTVLTNALPTGLDYPYVTALLPNNTIEIHSIETQAIVQVIGAPIPSGPPGEEGTNPRSRLNLIATLSGYLVPSTQRSDKMRTTPVRLLRVQETVIPSSP